MKRLPRTQESLVLRTDFTDDAAWQAVCEAITRPEPEDGFRAYVDFVDDPAFDGITVEQLLALEPYSSGHSLIFIVDSTTLTHSEHPILVVEVYVFDAQREQGIKPGRSFRVIPSEMWAVQNNLPISNMDFESFCRLRG